jgi:hypothetical protein
LEVEEYEEGSCSLSEARRRTRLDLMASFRCKLVEGFCVLEALGIFGKRINFG